MRAVRGKEVVEALKAGTVLNNMHKKPLRLFILCSPRDSSCVPQLESLVDVDRQAFFYSKIFIQLETFHSIQCHPFAFIIVCSRKIEPIVHQRE